MFSRSWRKASNASRSSLSPKVLRRSWNPRLDVMTMGRMETMEAMEAMAMAMAPFLDPNSSSLQAVLQPKAP